MSALMDEELQPRRIVQTPQEMTATRHESSRVIGRPIPPFPNEIRAYIDAGLEPPTE
ncbi:hypothetical protein M2284_002663 [Rhodococcus sp. LBL1]|nr:hypothetical protein [Rhodococcus sp. LBL1]MDH6684047.1 hypothetical protein [Rhodococcus sp. LBL2]